METAVLVAVGAILLAGLFLLVLGLSRIPYGRWTFEHRGQRIDVRNYMFREVVFVDEVEQTGSRSGGDYLTNAQHQVMLADSTKLRITIGAAGMSMACRVDDGSRVVFDSGNGWIAPPETARTEDPRVQAARVLLADIVAVDPEAARVLRASLEKVVAAELAALSTAEAHTALGGSASDAADLVRDRARAVEEVLATLRRLHLQVSGAHADDLDRVVAEAHDAVARVGATTEIHELRRRSRAVEG